MKVEMITPTETKLIGEYSELPDPSVIAATVPDFHDWFYSDEPGLIVAHADDGPYMLHDLPPDGGRDDGLWWDGPYESLEHLTILLK